MTGTKPIKPTKLTMVSSICAICLDAIDKSIAKLEPCNHKYHIDCIRTWHNYSNDLNCPTCRIETNQLSVNIYPEIQSPPVKITLKTGFNINKIEEYCELIRRQPMHGTTGIRRNDYHPLLNEEESVIYEAISDEFEENYDSDMENDFDNSDLRVAELNESFGNILNINDDNEANNNPEELIGTFITKQNDLTPSKKQKQILQCSICGETNQEINICCQVCKIIYHDSCLRSLALETNEPATWMNCIQCFESVTAFKMPKIKDDNVFTFNSDEIMIYNGQIRDINSVLSQQLYEQTKVKSLEQLRIAKTQIQSHVRKALHELNKNATTSVDKIGINDFTKINKKVSRELYKISDYEYKSDDIDYDSEAMRLVLIELVNLGYMNHL
ncbi:hypothetical protein TPHA_0A03340 [Tetrapisispora phaffii CBS 4417]|uniref:RING-type domain-containing protein n=1 Tax=Tetrapisispora phaffii (strain ATCC 24235 / CBS 4417 / NBRC 1672 / NRRL Y-8282 / UCD 70-5) TaxID=1071381 RepID=G8BND3_TETPH|nr:hypothetical protein TPHA_0A03340 [Tetrapisispora phaffii CBS 4417]CCE61411.1 hypothetical protein TPHA_0A03340 [Tetrapisispora phaffii CBS 4417]